MRFRVALCSHFPGDTDLVVHKRFFADGERLVHAESLINAFSVGPTIIIYDLEVETG